MQACTPPASTMKCTLPATRPVHVQPMEWGSVCGGRPGQRVEEQGAWALRTRKRSEAGCGRPEDGGVGTAKTVKRPPQQPAQPQYANYWAPLTRRRHILPHPAQPQHTNYWAPRTRKRHQQEHRPQRPTESSDPTQHAKGRTGDRPGPRKGATTRRNVTQGGGGEVVDNQDNTRRGGAIGPRAHKRGETCGGRPESGGCWATNTVKRPPQQSAQPPVRQLLGSANAEPTPQAAAAARTQRSDATREEKKG